MRYFELTENYSPEDDDQVAVKQTDTRVARLTLMHLSRLRNIREYRKYENSKRTDRLRQMYGTPSEGEGGDLGADDLGL